MPWTIADVEKHNKGLTDNQKEQWVTVANSALSSCQEEGGDDCEASAIMQANAAVKEADVEEATEPVEEQPESPLEEVGKRINAAQLANLRAIRDSVNELLAWADYDDDNVPDEEPMELDFQEASSGHALNLTETSQDPVVPLRLNVAIIEPGWGNKRDNHYYPAETLKRDAQVFEGVKMFETDHRSSEKSTRTWVSTVTGISGFTESGAPIGSVLVHDQSFAQRLLALNAGGILDRMECSILAGGKARKAKIDGRKGKVVESITTADSVDWVTRAGAGGRALSLTEVDAMPEEIEELGEAEDVTIEEDEEQPDEEPQEEPEAPVEEAHTEEPTLLSESEVSEALDATNLPDAAKSRLSAAQYAEQSELDAAIKGEIAYVKELTGSGKPFAQVSGKKERVQLTERDRTIRFNEIREQAGLAPVPVPEEE